MGKIYQQIFETRLSRRDFLRFSAVLGGAAMIPSIASASPQLEELAGQLTPPIEPISLGKLSFAELVKGKVAQVEVPLDYEVDILLRWGAGLFNDSPKFAPLVQTAESQAKQFGYNCDFTAFFPLPVAEAAEPCDERGVLCVNHEYPIPQIMFKDFDKANPKSISKSQVEVCAQAVGVSVVEIMRKGASWSYISGSKFNRRITATTEIAISGAAAGHKRLQTSYDVEGKKALGTLGNCAGGLTPWGTYLTAEENFDTFFGGELAQEHPEFVNYKSCSVGENDKNFWAQHDQRFDINKEPNEANRFGYIVEIDPLDAAATPVKRTSLGRFKHECATCALNHDRRVVVYSGDDEMFQFIYRFVSNVAPEQGKTGLAASVLDDGTLYAAKFNEDGTMTWLPLVFGTAPLNEENGFASQADVVIEARRAAKLAGATPMDRPEDIEVDAKTGTIYVSLTNNNLRKTDWIDAANPRGPNKFGHIIAIRPPVHGNKFNHASDYFEWDILLMGGNPAVPEDEAYYTGATSENGWISCPDNLALDSYGNLWIGSDGQPKTIDKSDSLYAYVVGGEDAGTSRLFLNVPMGAEATGPTFNPDATTLFLSVQHPAAEDGDSGAYDKAWPDFEEGMPPRPAVIAVRHKDGKKIGYA